MEIFSALLAICVGNSAVPGEFPAQRPVTRSFDVFFDLHLNKRLSKQSWGWWFEPPSCPLWRHRNVARTPQPVAYVHSIVTYQNPIFRLFCSQTAQLHNESVIILDDNAQSEVKWTSTSAGVEQVLIIYIIYIFFPQISCFPLDIMI